MRVMRARPLLCESCNNGYVVGSTVIKRRFGESKRNGIDITGTAQYFAPISQNKKDSTVAEDRPLRLVRAFNKENANGQYGWQMVDDTTVLERKKIPVCVFSNSESEPWAVWIRMYDFNAGQVLNYVQQCYDSNARTPEMSMQVVKVRHGQGLGSNLVGSHTAGNDSVGSNP